MLLSGFIKSAAAELEKLYPSPEAGGIVSILCRERLGVEPYRHIIEPSFEIPESALTRLNSDMERLCASEPLQYVLGYGDFYGRRFKLDPSVLIPRPETELLVEYVIKLASSFASPRILDLCTGSGCIAWSLLGEIPGCTVTGLDISSAALAVAESQSDGFPRPVFLQADLLSDTPLPAGFTCDILVSNPPYVTCSERSAMRPNVLEFEPPLALFVPDSDPLLFYRSIASVASGALAPDGWGIVEINERFGSETARVFESAGFSVVRVLPDLNGRDRFVTFENLNRQAQLAF